MNRVSDEEFWKWATSLKPCRYCNVKFVGPTCPNCESFSGQSTKDARRRTR